MSWTLNKAEKAHTSITNPYGDIKKEDNNINHTIKPIDREKANSEIEKGEIVFSPNGLLHKALGKKHSSGGTPVFLKGGSFVYSDYNKMRIDKKDANDFNFQTKKLLTPAKLLEKEVDIKHHNKMIDIQTSNKYDDISKKSSSLMLDKNFKKLGQIAFLQEEKKNFKNGIPSFSENTAPLYDKEKDAIVDQYRAGGFKRLPIFQKGAFKDFNEVYDYYRDKHGYDKEGKYKGNIDNWQKWAIENFNDELYNYLQSVPLTNKGINLYGNKKPGDLTREQLFNQFNDGKFKYRAFKPIHVNIGGLNKPPEPKPPSLITNQPIEPEKSFRPYTSKEETENTPTLPYTASTELTPTQKLMLGNDAYNWASINKYFPRRNQESFIPLTLERYDTQPYINNINNQTQQAYKANSVLNPIQARASNSNIYGTGLQNINQAISGVYDKNVSQSNNEAQYNNQGYNAVNNANIKHASIYQDQVNSVNEHYDQEEQAARNNLFQNLGKYKTDNLSRAMGEMSLPMGTKEVWIGPNGQRSDTYVSGWKKYKQSSPLYTFNPNNESVTYSGASLPLDYMGAGSKDKASAVVTTLLNKMAEGKQLNQGEYNIITAYFSSGKK